MDDYGDHDIIVDSGGHWVYWVIGFHRPFTKGATSNEQSSKSLYHSIILVGSGWLIRISLLDY